MRATWMLLVMMAGLLAVQAMQLEDKVPNFRPKSVAPPRLVQQVTKILEDFKAIMKTGRTDFNIPVLDPAVVATLPVDVKHGPFNAEIVATDCHVKGVSEFTVTKVEQITGTNKLTLNIEVPEIDIVGTFDMKGKVKISLWSLKINDHGPLALTVKGAKLSALVEVLENDDESYNVKTVTVDSWTYDSLWIQLDKLLGGGFLGEQANALFNKIFPVLVESDRVKIDNWIETVTKKIFNKYLDGLSGKETANLEAELRKLSEAFRAAMKTGRPDLNLPVMDPAVIDQFLVHVYCWPFDAQVVARDIKVAGGSKFQFTNVLEVLGTNKVTVDFTFPSINMGGQYLIENANLGFIKLNTHFQGPLKVNIEGLKVTAKAELIVDTDNALSLRGLQVDSWTYDAFQVEVNNLSSGGFLMRKLNSLINSLIPSLFIKTHVDDISEWAAKRGEMMIGRFLDAAAGRVIISNLGAKATKLLEEFRTVMKEGSDAYKIPVLDPTSFGHIPIAFHGKLIDATITGKELQIAGTSNYIIPKISQIEGTNQLEIEVEVPEIIASGKFDVDGEMKILFQTVPIQDHGSVKVTIKGLKNFATATMTENVSGFLSLTGLKINDWKYSQIKAEFADLHIFGAELALNTAVNALLPLVIETQRDKLTAWSERAVTANLDRFLTGVAAEPTIPNTYRIENISDYVHEIISKLTLLTVSAGLAA